MEYSLFFDTNALLNLQEAAFKEHFIISQKTLEEIENIKSSSNKDGEVKYKARKLSRLLDENVGTYTVLSHTKNVDDVIDKYYLEKTPDNIILATAYLYSQINDINILVVSDDLNCKFISREIFELRTKGINEINIVRDISEYKGFKDITLSDDEMSFFYNNMQLNIYDCLLNEYLIIRKSDGEIVDYRKWNGEEYKALSYKTINNRFIGKVKPINPEQIISFDMLQNKELTIKILSGKAGSGKDFTMISNAIKMIDDGKFDKLIYVVNAVGVKNAEEIGYLPGEVNDKLKPFVMKLADHLGGEQGLDMKIMSGNIEIVHLGHMRGRDLKNSIVYCSEAENLTKEHVQMLIGRIGDGSMLWMNGDYKQVDSSVYRMNNGLLSAVQKLAGHKKFGYVQLQKTERSETASMADLLD